MSLEPKHRTVAYVTAEVDFLDPDPDYDLPNVVAALESAGLQVAVHNWDAADVDWAAYDAVLVRSTWNYAARRDAFVQWAREVDAQTMLLNPSEVIADNTDKIYLERLIAAGVPVIPTQVLRPGDAVDWNAPQWRDAEVVVVKPTVGAGAIGASRNDSQAAVEAAIDAHHAVGNTVLVQPYLDAVDTSGEIAIIVIGGEVSHAIKKVPALTVGGHGDPAESVAITSTMEAFVDLVAAQVPEWDDLLYARVDVVPDGDSGFVLMELELTEPALFFSHDDAATGRFVGAVLDRLQ